MTLHHEDPKLGRFADFVLEKKGMAAEQMGVSPYTIDAEDAQTIKEMIDFGIDMEDKAIVDTILKTMAYVHWSYCQIQQEMMEKMEEKGYQSGMFTLPPGVALIVASGNVMTATVERARLKGILKDGE